MKAKELFKAVEQVIGQEEYQDRKLKLIGIGSERAVFKVDGIDGRVFKISREDLEQRVRMLLFDSISSQQEQDRVVIEHQIKEWKDEQELEAEAVEIFGEEHFLKRGIFRVTIPVTKDLIVKCFSEKDENGEVVMNTREGNFVLDIPDGYVVSVKMLADSQEESDVATNPDKYYKIDFAAYLITVGDFYVKSKSIPEASAKTRKKLDKQIKIMKDFIEDRHNEGPLLREIVEKIILYTKKTGRMVDTFGYENILVYAPKEGNEAEDKDIENFDYKIIELTLPGGKDFWMITNEEDKKRGLEALRHHYTFYYFIRTIAKKMGIENNLNLDDMYYFRGTNFLNEDGGVEASAEF